MGINKTGCYHIFDGRTGRLVITRPDRASAEEGEHYTKFVKLAESDNLFLTLEDPQVDASIEVELASYVSPTAVEFRPKNPIFMDTPLYTSIMPGSCSKCSSPLPTYDSLLRAGVVQCPYCEAVFATVEASPMDMTGLSLARNKPELFGDNGRYKVALAYKLPYGFPTPRPIAFEEMEAKHFNLITEEAGLEWALPDFFKHLNRHEIVNDDTDDGDEQQEVENPEE